MRHSLTVSFCLLIALAGCTGRPSGLVIAGSTSVQPMAEMLAEEYVKEGGSRVSIQGGGSTAGVQAVLSGAAAVGAISRRLAQSESAQGLVEHIIGYDVLTVVVHPSNPVTNLPRAQLARLFAGDVKDWAEVGVRSGPVRLISREAGSGSREAFRQLVGPVSRGAIVQNSAGAIRVAVMADPAAIGYVSLGVARMGGLKLAAIDGQSPAEPRYPLVRPLSFVTRGRAEGETARFVAFARSSAGQRILQAEGLVPIRDWSPVFQ